MVAGGAGRREQPEPGIGPVVRQAGLGRRGHAGQQRGARLRRHRQAAQAPRVVVRRQERGRVEAQLDLARHQVHKHGRAAAVRHVRGHAPDGIQEGHSANVGRAAGTASPVGHLARLCLDQGDQPRQIGDTQRGMDGDADRHHDGRRHSHEIAFGVIGQARTVQAYRQHLGRDRAHQEDAAVGRGFGHRIGAKRATGAPAVLDDDGLAEHLRDARRQQPRRDVGAAAGGERYDDAHRTRRSRGLGEYAGWQPRGRQGQDGTTVEHGQVSSTGATMPSPDQPSSIRFTRLTEVR